ncbi:nucleotidyltransferase family protein [Streptacidiphilus sp. EB103A]|uniref:nucleotidyltransferase family protein n=1 Tax=Streptacidiphilus sp. EB103A TaxID=3156275 RepID=UPI003514EC9B
MPVLDYAVVRDNPRHAHLDAADLRRLATADPHEQAVAFAATVLRNPTVRGVLERLAPLDLPPWYLTAGSLFQTVWNVAAGAPDLNAGIRDHDLFFYEGQDLSYEAEDVVIKRIIGACQGLGADVEPRNEARVHLWYAEKFGKTIEPYRDLPHAVSGFAATCCCVALNLSAGGDLEVYSTHGFTDLFTGVLRPNAATVAPRAVYEDKAERWTRVWPHLTKLPWPQEPVGAVIG